MGGLIWMVECTSPYITFTYCNTDYSGTEDCGTKYFMY